MRNGGIALQSILELWSILLSSCGGAQNPDRRPSWSAWRPTDRAEGWSRCVGFCGVWYLKGKVKWIETQDLSEVCNSEGLGQEFYRILLSTVIKQVRGHIDRAWNGCTHAQARRNQPFRDRWPSWILVIPWRAPVPFSFRQRPFKVKALSRKINGTCSLTARQLAIVIAKHDDKTGAIGISAHQYFVEKAVGIT